jgi:hypothetical protein
MQIAQLIHLVDAAEQVYPYVSLERIRNLARDEKIWQSGTAGLGMAVRKAVRGGILFSEMRTRLTRTGEYRPLRVYRLNRRDPQVARALST